MKLVDALRPPNQDEVSALNEVFKHAGLIFSMNDLVRELDELVDDAKTHNIKVCPHCGWAYKGTCTCQK